MQVLLTDPTMSQRLDELKTMAQPLVEWQVCDHDEEQLLKHLANADVFIGSPFTGAMAKAAPSLRLIQLAGAGTGGVDFSTLPEDVSVANTYNHEQSIAEYVLMCMLALSRRLLIADRQLRSGNWYAVRHDSAIPLPEMLEGKTVSIVGFGHIGQQVARLSGLMGMKVLAIKRAPDVELQQEFGLSFLGSPTDLPQILRQADFLVIAAPLTAETQNLIDGPLLEAMRSDAFLINVARGPIVDQQALYNALLAGHIAGAAIDTWYEYPGADGKARPASLPFHELDNVIMTPHTSGETLQTVSARARDIADNINRLSSGQALRNVVYP